MKKNGFITPLTLVISFILLSTILHQIKTLEQERLFLMEEKQVFLLEQLLQMATTDMLEMLKASTNLIEGTFDYEHGTVTYQILEKTNEEVRVRLRAFTDQGRKNQVILYYNLNNQELTEWVEI
jgi:hypothetical protein